MKAIVASLVGLVVFITVLTFAAIESMREENERAMEIAFPIAVVAAALAWTAVVTPRARLRFDLAFGGGVSFLLYSALLACRTIQSDFAVTMAFAVWFKIVWFIPMACAFGTFVGLLMIVWAILRD